MEGKFRLSIASFLVSQRPNLGLAAAKIEVRAFKVATIPALAIETEL